MRRRGELPKLAECIAEESRRLTSLRMQMLEMHPFWGYLLLQVKLVPAPELQCFAATDCIHHIWYNPALTWYLSTSQMGFILAHEVGHQLFASEDRRGGRSQYLWNCATDYAINRIIAEISHPARPEEKLYAIPSGKHPELGDVRILLDQKYEGMISEAIYEYLASESLPAPVSVTLTLPRWRAGAGDSSGDGEAVDLEIPNLTDHRGGIDVHLPDTLEPYERRELVGRVAGALEAWAQSERRGTVPLDLVRRIVAKQKPRIPWQRILRRFANQALSKDEYSLTRPNRKYLADEILVPGLVGEKAGLVVVAVDTSGSMTEDDLEAVISELQRLRESVQEMTLLVGDCQVHQAVTSDEIEHFLLRGRFQGGGGTDHRPFFEWVLKEKQRPDLFVGLTDLYSEFPDSRPPYPVMWVTPPDHAPAPWGQIVEVSQP